MKIKHYRNNVLGANRDIYYSTFYAEKGGVFESRKSKEWKKVPDGFRNLSWTCPRNEYI